MIICPNCKEEIDDKSNYCDQCGHELLYCDRCGRVGLGRRCTHCGGLMVTAERLEGDKSRASYSLSGYANMPDSSLSSTAPSEMPVSQVPGGIPVLTLVNDSLNIRIVGINGAVIGRRKGPYVQFFEQQPYVSGVHAQLKYMADGGWSIADKHSSNGTRLNQHPLQPDVDMTINNGDIVTIANINLQVIIR